MRAWRHRCKVSGLEAAAAAPLITSVTVNELNDSEVFVAFDQPVTWDTVGSGTFAILSNPIIWSAQDDSVTLRGSGAGPFAPGDPWNWDAPDTSLSPVPDPGQTGVI